MSEWVNKTKKTPQKSKEQKNLKNVHRRKKGHCVDALLIVLIKSLPLIIITLFKSHKTLLNLYNYPCIKGREFKAQKN